MRNKLNILKLIISLAIPQIIGFIASLFTMKSISSWYATINKASFNPSNYVFGPTWILLYVLMGISFYLIWNSNNAKNDYKKFAYFFFWFQLILNFFWSILFFGLHNPLLAFLDIVLLWLVLLFNIIFYYKISKLSAYLQMPYLIWVSFASILNLFVIILN